MQEKFYFEQKKVPSAGPTYSPPPREKKCQPDLMISRRFRVLETEALTVGRRKGGLSIGGWLDLSLVGSDQPFD